MTRPGFIIITEYAYCGTLLRSSQHQRYQMCLRRMRFANIAFGISSGCIEISQRNRRPYVAQSISMRSVKSLDQPYGFMGRCG
jgi:hypothetical protein